MIDPETGMSLEFFSLGMILQRHEWAVMPAVLLLIDLHDEENR